MAAKFNTEKPRSTTLDSGTILNAARNKIHRLNQNRIAEIKEKSSEATEVIIDILDKDGGRLRKG